jgi:hypothetical protein
MHHAYLGGLLEHVIGLCGLAKQIAAHYPELDVDLLLTAAILHDVGKLGELCYERAIGYTVEGQLLGHIMMEFETDLDSKLAAARAALAVDTGEPEWSAYSGALGRKFLRLDQFLKSTSAKAEEGAPNPKLFQ